MVCLKFWKKKSRIYLKKLGMEELRILKKEEVRIKMIRTLAYLSKTYARIKEAQKVEELEKKIEILEKA